MTPPAFLFGTCTVCTQEWTAPRAAKRPAESYKKERAFALRVMRQAAALCTRAPREAVLKRDATPVTVTDIAIQAIITKALGEEFPDDILVGEEEATGHEDDSFWHSASEIAGLDTFQVMREANATRSSHANNPLSRYWTLDPIDGTKGFVSGRSYAIGFALLDPRAMSLDTPKSPLLGALALPTEGVVLLADVEGKCLEQHMLEAQEKEERLVGFRRREKYDTRSENKLDWTLSGIPDLRVQNWPPWTPLCCGSLVKYAAVARGNAKVFVQVVHGKFPAVWDHAAGVAAVLASGGAVSDERGRPVSLGAGAQRRDVQVSPGALAIVATRYGMDHDTICDKVRTTLSAEVDHLIA